LSDNARSTIEALLSSDPHSRPDAHGQTDDTYIYVLLLLLLLLLLSPPDKAAGVKTEQGVYNGSHHVHSDDNVLRKETAFPY